MPSKGETVLKVPKELFVDTVTAESEDEESAYADIRLGPQNKRLTFKLDTGAQTCVIPAKDFATLMPGTPLMADTHKLLAYGGHPLKVNGYCSLVGRYKDKSKDGPPILSYRACKNLGLIKVVYAVTDTSEEKCNTQSADILSIGEFQGECSFRIDPNVAPVVCPPRRVPFALRDRLKTELNNMERDSIICKGMEPTQWVNALLTCEKPKTHKLRVCLNPRPLNKAILRPYYPLPTLEDVTCKLAGAKYFSILDARSGYWAIKLSEESSLLITFNMIFGRYRFLRLPFGIVSAQDEFQRRIDETYEGLEGVAGIVDDIMKETITAELGPVLAYFDPKKEVTLQVDTSKNGLGATIMQEGKPVAYASKLLNNMEKNYAQIEKELYAVLYGCITVESDHKPLESILRKPLALAPPRLQRMLLALQKYSITLIHRLGKEIPVADMLPRKSLEDEDSLLSEAMETQVHSVISAASVSADRLDDIKASTAQDEQLSILKQVIRSGWPETRKNCHPCISEYWNHRN
ncbi:hypothetical protein N1851_026595 [Merluccius polli]|uniref:Reverse transcriptase/retrotransposon-derived protein RNase H-like domain-containing protein n=1 Tax=Merluccius polli TaxID=89951 RepID=A0AA47NTW4_MERPO|nr:hypothetical protein N1851_026595 [Merluccius polli]